MRHGLKSESGRLCIGGIRAAGSRGRRTPSPRRRTAAQSPALHAPARRGTPFGGGRLRRHRAFGAGRQGRRPVLGGDRVPDPGRRPGGPAQDGPGSPGGFRPERPAVQIRGGPPGDRALVRRGGGPDKGERGNLRTLPGGAGQTRPDHRLQQPGQAPHDGGRLRPAAGGHPDHY